MKTSNLKKLERALWRLVKVREEIHEQERGLDTKVELDRANEEWGKAWRDLRARRAEIAEKKDAGVICFEVFKPTFSGLAVQHITRTPNRMIKETLWKCSFTGQLKPDKAPHVECDLYRSPELDFKLLQEVAA